MSIEQRLSQVLGRKVNLAHEPMMDILKELLVKLEEYQAEYQDTVKAIRKHYAEGKR
jgi:hypothetical protein